MEYCLSTVNEFLNDIRHFQSRSQTIKRDRATRVDSSVSDDDDRSSIDTERRMQSSLSVNEHVRGFVKQLLQALMALHEQNIVHCDVKGDNVFIANENGHFIVKLGVGIHTCVVG
jgi:serine/threonine protein kinase